MMRRTAGLGLSMAAIVLSLVALMVGSAGLFYMSTAIIVTILAGRLQAWLSVQYLRVERLAPNTASVGELVSVEVIVWSEKKIRRPLVTIEDELPRRMRIASRTPSLPIAPAYDLPIRSQYRFRPTKRGRYRWSGLIIHGSDALGLSTVSKRYPTDVTELLVVPTPMRLAIDPQPAGGLGISEAGTGQARGGLEPRGIREYAPGDSLRHVHWRSSARVGTLLVKEFEAGSQALYGFLFQRSINTDVGTGPMSSLDLMCGHALALANDLARAGAEVILPQLEVAQDRERGALRFAQMQVLLASINADSPNDIGTEVEAALQMAGRPSVLYIFISHASERLISALASAARSAVAVTVLLYDPQVFTSARLAGNSCLSLDYLDQLTESAARSIIVPINSNLEVKPNGA